MLTIDDVIYLTDINEKVSYAIITIFKIGIWEARRLQNSKGNHTPTLQLETI